ncbi:putative transmembrane anti-sigma factor [Pseudomonas sp. M47T1]|uniref:anti-sigma factor family protein n=1 Tax=Pseudomonas sp. M47T1 TaxID=1179778 RepID=UPI0002608869|nr:anti-sigma factor [Pseudomonas sp. M47T1]EIK95438.1 putative transmembrane anti-sigma factor [Pseudomonas sp. M47T1]
MTDLDHATCIGLLDAYLDQELAPAQRARVQAHLAGCPGCAQRFSELTRWVASVKTAAPRFPAPASLATLMHALHAPPAKRPRAAWFHWLAPLGSALALALALVLYLNVPGTAPGLVDEAVSSHVRSLMGQHLNDVVSSDRHTVKPWFTGKLDFSPPVTDFGAAGFPLLGGRLDYLQHQTAAALTYGHGQHLINVFILPTAATDTPRQSLQSRGYNLVTWRQGHMQFVAVSDVDHSELERLAQLLNQQP